MSDLSDEEIARWLQSVPCAKYEPADMQRMALEIQRHRAAKATDKERIQKVVAVAAVNALYTANIDRDVAPIAGDIAARAAEQLAGAAVGLSDADRSVLIRLRGEALTPDPSHSADCPTCVRSRETVALLDRLIGGV